MIGQKDVSYIKLINLLLNYLMLSPKSYFLLSKYCPMNFNAILRINVCELINVGESYNALYNRNLRL